MPKLLIPMLFLVSTYSFSQSNSKTIFHLDAGKGIKSDSMNFVSEWTDANSSIISKQLTANNRPIYVKAAINNLPALRFDGAKTFMNLPSVFPVRADYTIAVVCKADAITNNILGGTSRTLWMGGSTTPTVLHNGDFNNQARSTIDPGTDPCLIVAQYRYATKHVSFYINGQFADSSYCPDNIDSTIFIAAYQSAYNFNGHIAEIILYKNILSGTERSSLETTLINKYKLPAPKIVDRSIELAPANHQLYPRDENNICKVEISGRFNDSNNYDSISIELRSNDTLLFQEKSKLNYTSGIAPFKWNFNLKAGLYSHKFVAKVYKNGIDSTLLLRDNVVCGDVYIITGQSNSIFGGSQDTDPFCKTFGRNYSTRVADTLWTSASAVGNGGGPDIGAWGIHLAKLLIQQYKIPICIMNGGVGGTSIQQHQRNDNNPSVPNNIYGSLLYRMKKSNLTTAAKGIFWYQGESNNSNGYFDNFKSLYEDWKNDYPNVKHLYVVQIHHGCGAGDHANVREVQRNLPKTFPDIHVMSTNNLPFHDGCHYGVPGYNQLAKWLLPLVQRDFYNQSFNKNIDPPNITQAAYTSTLKNRIALIFGPTGQNLKATKDTLIQNVTTSVKDYFALDGQFQKVQSIDFSGDTVFLNLITSSSAKKITYLPEVNYFNTNIVYRGPYIINDLGIGALSFHQVDIADKLITETNQLIPSDMHFENNLQNREWIIWFENDVHNVELEYYSMNGKLVKKNKHNFIANQKHIISASEFEGLTPLVLKIQSNNRTYVLKLI
ncbi:MAG: hypothetical protein HOP11_04135 [Saprospiraceae bacterium]|nr:hypothetical protein [Saprospiraceae bacterium]